MISSPAGEEDEDGIALGDGKYTIHVCGKNIGKDMFSYDEEFDEFMDDDEYCKLDKFESYDIYLEPA